MKACGCSTPHPPDTVSFARGGDAALGPKLGNGFDEADPEGWAGDGSDSLPVRSDESTEGLTEDTHRSVCEKAAFTLSAIVGSEGVGAFSGVLLDDNTPVLDDPTGRTGGRWSGVRETILTPDLPNLLFATLRLKAARAAAPFALECAGRLGSGASLSDGHV